MRLLAQATAGKAGRSAALYRRLGAPVISRERKNSKMHRLMGRATERERERERERDGERER